MKIECYIEEMLYMIASDPLPLLIFAGIVLVIFILGLFVRDL
ncbi:hypothetical protein [Enterococcus plantarum]|nr:hypothetical protein [Enterococcus plantarum]